jgi:hypothetical protein
MSTLMVASTETFQWHSLITEAEDTSLIALSEDAESHLVFLLSRFVTHPEIANSVLGLEYLESMHSHLHLRQYLLQEVGDKCLLMAGLFPSRSRKKLVKISYFVHIGQNAYATIGNLSSRAGIRGLYTHLSQAFVPMMDVLQTTRELGEGSHSQLNLFDAYDLWYDTKSAHALKTIREYTARQ